MTPPERVACATHRTRKRSRAARPARRHRSGLGRRQHQSRRRAVQRLLLQRRNRPHHHQQQQQTSASGSLTMTCLVTLSPKLLSPASMQQRQTCSSWGWSRPVQLQQPAARLRHHPGSSQQTTGWCARSQRWADDVATCTETLHVPSSAQQHPVAGCHAGGSA